MDPSHLTQKSTEALHDAQTKALRENKKNELYIINK